MADYEPFADRAGLTLRWDQIIRTPLFSPRLAGTYILDDEGNTKLSAGIGIIYDTTNLGLIHQPFEGQRVDYFFNPSGQPTDAKEIIDRSCSRADYVCREPERAGSAAVFELERWLEKKLPYESFSRWSSWRNAACMASRTTR